MTYDLTSEAHGMAVLNSHRESSSSSILTALYLTSSPLSGVKRCPLFRGSVYISYIGESASAKARCPLDRYPQFEVSAIRGSTVYHQYSGLEITSDKNQVRLRHRR